MSVTEEILTEEIRKKAEPVVCRYATRRAAILPVLRLIQERYGYVPEEAEAEVADYLEIPLIDVREVLTFYTLFHRRPVGKTCLNICRTLSCRLRGSEEILKSLEDRLGIKPGETTADGQFTLESVECLGACELAPMMEMNGQYVGPLTTELVDDLLRHSEELPQAATKTGDRSLRHRGQVTTLQSFSDLSPVLISKFFDRGRTYFLDDYLKEGGYEALRQVLEKFKPNDFIEEVKKSNLRGLGGAGFPAGMKWSFVPKNTGRPVYLVVNADEGEPGTFKDRYILVNAPHLLLEGIALTAYANLVQKAFVYLRGEYEEPYQILLKALGEAEARGFLGKNILGKNFDLEIVLHQGAGAYIAGEETGLLESLEGKKAFPRLKPPYPAVVGLFGSPTVINNVETLSYLPFIAKMGAEAFAKLGSPRNGGLRLYSVSGHVQRPGVYERPLGYSLRKLIEEAGGVDGGRKLKAVVPGGLSAAVLKADEIDVSLDFDQLKAAGTMAGSAGIIVMDETTCMLEALTVTMGFFGHESCGQCSPCREGTGWVAKILNRILEGRGRAGDIDTLLDLGGAMSGTTICALADGAAMPLGSYLKKFRSEFEFHIREKRCDIQQTGLVS